MKWFVRSTDDLHSDIELIPNEVISLGRSTETRITDRSISKLHTLLKYQPAKNIVLCKHLGKHPALINGELISKDMKVRIGLSSVIELIPGCYRYTLLPQKGIKRRLSPEPSTSNTSPSKRLQTTVTTPTLPQDRSEVKNSSIISGGSSSGGISSSGSRGRISDALQEFLLRKLECEGRDDTLGSPWVVTKDLIVRNSAAKGCSKVAAFDLDHTIITTKSGNVFPRDTSDWEIMWPGKVTQKLKEYHNEGYKLLVISNQNGIEARKLTVQQFQDKVDEIVGVLGLPVQVMAAPRSTATRKPAPGMWLAFERFYNDNVSVDYDKSFYVGDAAGRTAGWDPNKKKRKDFSSSDREFAQNIGLKFYTPEAFFLGQQESPQWRFKSFNPRSYLAKSLPLLEGNKQLLPDKQEVAILVGYPGSGKSSFCRSHLSSYTRINLDEQRNYGKCMSLMDSSLSSGKSVVVDNTCPDPATRKRYIEVAVKHDLPVRCFLMTTSIEHARHNNRYRRLAEAADQVPGIAFNTFKSRYQEPSISEEGFSDIVRVNLVPDFGESHLEELYNMFQGG